MMKFASEWAFSALLRDHRARYSTKIDFSMHHTNSCLAFFVRIIGGQEVLGLLRVFALTFRIDFSRTRILSAAATLIYTNYFAYFEHCQI